MEPVAASELALRLAWEAGRLVFRRQVDPDLYLVQSRYEFALRDRGDENWDATADSVPLTGPVRRETALFACLVAEGLAARGFRLWSKPDACLLFAVGRVSTLLLDGYLYSHRGDGRVELSRIAFGGRRTLGRYDAIGGAVLAATLARAPLDILAEPQATGAERGSPLADSLRQATSASHSVADAVQTARTAITNLQQASADLSRIATALREQGRSGD